MLVEIFGSTYIENSQGKFWRVSDFKLSPVPSRAHPPLYVAAATTPDSAIFAGTIGQVWSAWLSWYPSRIGS